MGIINELLAGLSPTEKKLLAILGLLASKSVKTRGEREIREYTKEAYKSDGIDSEEPLEKLEMNSKAAMNEILDAMGVINSRGFTKKDILKRLEEYSERIRKMATTQATKDTYKPDEDEFAVFSCPSCGFTVDASKHIPPTKLKCPICLTIMRGVKREDFYTKDNIPGFNDVDDSKDMPEDPKVKP